MDAFANNLAQLVEEWGKALAAYIRPREAGKKDELADDVADAVRTSAMSRNIGSPIRSAPWRRRRA